MNVVLLLRSFRSLRFSVLACDFFCVFGRLLQAFLICGWKSTSTAYETNEEQRILGKLGKSW